MEKTAIINSITNAFIDKYFDMNDNWFWVNEEIGGVFNINDCWFDFQEILYCICNNITKRKFFELYFKFEEQIEQENNAKKFIDFLENNS